jgi:hypothetical protein
MQQDGIAGIQFGQPVQMLLCTYPPRVMNSLHSDSTAERKCHAVIAVLNCGRGCSETSLAGKRGPPDAHGSYLRPSDSRINFLRRVVGSVGVGGAGVRRFTGPTLRVGRSRWSL